MIDENVYYYENIQHLRLYWTNYEFKKLREPFDKYE